MGSWAEYMYIGKIFTRKIEPQAEPYNLWKRCNSEDLLRKFLKLPFLFSGTTASSIQATSVIDDVTQDS